MCNLRRIVLRSGVHTLAIPFWLVALAVPACDPAEDAARVDGEPVADAPGAVDQDGPSDGGDPEAEARAPDADGPGAPPDTEGPGAPTDTAAPDAPAPPAGAAAAAVDVIHAYYRAIDAGNYERAYDYWAGNGSASGQTFEEFRSGFAATASVEVSTGEPGGIGAAAGSRYIEIPVTITAVTTDGATQLFSGTYTLRRSVVTGATAEQRRWHLYSAEIVEV